MSIYIKRLSWKTNQLWEGCMLASIAHAIMVAHYPELSNEHSWDGINYNVQDSMGSRGTITFDTKYCVGAFCNIRSERFKGIKNVKTYLGSAPKAVVELAENEALQYLLENVGGKVIPIITTAFWAEDGNYFTRDTTEELYHNGVFLLERQLMDFNKSVESWVKYYDMSAKQSNLLRKIAKERIKQKSGTIILSKEDVEQIGVGDLEMLEESEISFKEIGILLS